MTGSFWDTTTSGISVSAGGTGLATAAMQTLGTYIGAGWSADNAGGTGLVWRVYDGFAYPVLRSFLTSATVTANSATVTYNAQAQSLTGYTLSSGVDVTHILGTPSVGSASATNVGTYSLGVSGLYSDQHGYDISFVAGSLTISPAALTVTADALSRTYGAANPTLTYGTTGLLGNDTLTGALATGATGASGVGSYAITQGTLSAGSNYALSYHGANLTINPAALTVTFTANTAGSTYGVAPAGLSGVATADQSGLFNGDTLAQVVGGTATWSTTATKASNVGSYAITGSGLSAINANYALTTVQAAGNATALTISPATLAVTYIANAAASTYGQTPGGLSGSASASGLVNNDTLAGVTSGTAAWSTTATGASNVGSYGITGGGLAANSANYSFSFAQAAGNANALTINPASLTVTYTATPESATYGAAFAAPGGVVSANGLVNNDTLAGVTGGSATWTTPAVQGSNAGSYGITGSGLSANSGNYSFNFVQAAGNASALTINPAAITVTYTAAAAGSVYGVAPAGLTGRVSVNPGGLVGNDTLAQVVGGTATWSTTATKASNVGSYAITGSGLTAINANYALTTVQAAGNATALTISPASLAVTANAQSRVYGAANPALGYTATGLVNGDTLSGALATSATGASNVGTYAITQGTLVASSNYLLTYTGASLTITPASLTVTYTATPASFVVNSPITGLTGTVSTAGLVNGDTLAGTAAWTTTATAASPAGLYAITGGGLSASANYRLTTVQAAGNATALVITQQPASAFGSNALPDTIKDGHTLGEANPDQSTLGSNDVGQPNLTNDGCGKPGGCLAN